MRRAFTRAVSPRLPECQLTHLQRVPIDAAKAAEQHAAYERALADAGFEVIRLPELADDPDGVFVEDTALLLGEHAVITRPGAESPHRRDRTPRLQVWTGRSRFTASSAVTWTAATPSSSAKRLYVGLSTRTDAEGIASLAEIAAPLGYEVIRAELRDCLHLKTGATFAGADGAGTPVLLYDQNSVDAVQFTGVEPFAVDEPAAANCVRAGDRLIVPAGNPRTVARLRNRGFQVTEVDVSELRKAESGVTCMSLIDDRS